MSLLWHDAVAKKRSIALNVSFAVRTATTQEDIDLVSGDFNGASCRRQREPQQQYDITLEEAFKTPGVLSRLAPQGPWRYSA